MKNSMYFPSVEALNDYFGGPDKIPSNVLAIVGNPDDEEYVLYTVSNNQSINGTMQDQGGYVTDWAEVEQLGYIIPAGSYEIINNGLYDVTSYVNASVSVPASAVTSGTKEVTVNGDYDVTSYKTVTVLVEGQTEYDSIDVVDNGHVNVSSYAFAYVSVPASAVTSGTKSITENGVADVTTYASVDVNVPIPAGYTYVSGTKSITENGVADVTTYASVDVNVPIPAGYVIPAGDYMSNISEWETVIDGENPSEMTVNLTSPNVSEYETVTIGLQGQLPENASYVYENGMIEVSPLDEGHYNSYIYVDVPTGGVTPEGTYYVTDNGTYDISSYEYVDVSVSGMPVNTYTWSGLTRGGNPDINQSGESSDNNNNALMLYVKTGSGYRAKYTQIIPDRQYAYQLPTSITARQWDDYNPSTYIMTESSGCTYSCDPSNYDNLTNVMNTNGGSSGMDCSYEVSGLDVYGLSDYSMTTAGFFGSTVHNLSKLTDLKCIQWNTDDPSNPYEENVKSTMLCAALTDTNHTAYIAETSYFQGMTDVRNLAGRTWKMIFNQYQGRLSLKDIVGPVSGSEIYMNEIDDVWANWMGGWNSSTSSSYNSSTGNIELQYTANYVLSNAPSTAELHQLEYRLTSGGTARRIDTEVVGSLGTADHTNLSGTVTLNAIPRTNENYHYVNLFNIDNSDLQNEGYTQYDLTLTLKIPHDMWLYGSANHNQMTLDWVLTPSATVVTDDVTALQTSVGTSWYTGNRVSGEGSSGTWSTQVMKSNKATSNLENYKIYEINVTGTTSGTHNFVPDLNSPDSLDINNLSGSWEGPLVAREDQNGKQMFTLDTTDMPSTATLQVSISVTDGVLDPDNSEYMKCHIDYQITY